ncbi:MAG: ABC transporter ATP-binding protein [Bifidobacteriaceae bacterium]|jgi:peptide/nickel transport system ATP-binding protein|nr:ABC transporter ATP-binding protein [Bifidobacteriaceae bacterium]
MVDKSAGASRLDSNSLGSPAPETPALDVRDLTVEFWTDDAWVTAAKDVTFQVGRGEVVALVGESGSGKTQTAMALMGLLPPNGRASGSAKLGGQELVGLTGRAMTRVRGQRIGMVFQEPMTALHPVYTIGFQIAEALRAHRQMSPKAARQAALEALELVDMPEPAQRLDFYPHQLSGGQRQRAMIAQALALDPALLLADEPTTALDVTVQAEILELLRSLRGRIGAGIVLITHDMGIVADLADRVLVMSAGRLVEQGGADQVFYTPHDPYTKALLAAVPRLRLDPGGSAQPPSELPESAASTQSPEQQRPPDSPSARSPATGPTGSPADAAGPGSPPPALTAPRPSSADSAAKPGPILIADKVNLVYQDQTLRRRSFQAITEVSLSIGPGEVLGLVGESGSGKTTFGRAAVGLLAVHSGSLAVAGTELRGLGHKGLRQLRRKVSMVFQDPASSLNPRLPVGQSVGEPLRLIRRLRGRTLDRAVGDLFDQVKLSPAMRNRYPHELSGGQRQRIGLARALALEPRLLIADEPTSALDVSVQATVLELLRELQRSKGFACLFISHDLAVVQELAGRIAVLKQGRLVEAGPTNQVLSNPQSEYTANLVAAVPIPDPAVQRARRKPRDHTQHHREGP